jgi:hypothetical protein
MSEPIQIRSVEAWITRKELAALMGVSLKSIDRYTAEGMPSQLWGARTRRYRASECFAWGEKRVAPPNHKTINYEHWEPDERDYARVLVRDPCSYCGELCRHIDHIHPRSRGGEDVWSNFTASCAACNLSKSARSMLQFLLLGCATS